MGSTVGSATGLGAGAIGLAGAGLPFIGAIASLAPAGMFSFTAGIALLALAGTFSLMGGVLPLGPGRPVRTSIVGPSVSTGLTRRCERAQARIIPLVFHRSGRPIHSFRRSWKEACKKAGLPGLLFHDLRRSAVRNLERANVPRSVAMKLTGHKTESIYRRYAIVAEADLREAGVKLSALADSVQKGQATT